MPVERWTAAGWAGLREGQILFDLTPAGQPFSAYHAMLVEAPEPGPIHSSAGLPQLKVSHMRPPLTFATEPDAVHELGEKTYRGYFVELDDDALLRVIEAVRAVEARAISFGRYCYSLATHGTMIPDPNNPGETLPAPHCSCASLVEWCYEQAGVDLVAEQSLPTYTLNEIYETFVPRDAQGRQVKSKELIAKLLRRWGLPEADQWPLLLPAQQMRACQLQLAELPHHAAKIDHPFLDN